MSLVAEFDRCQTLRHGGDGMQKNNDSEKEVYGLLETLKLLLHAASVLPYR